MRPCLVGVLLAGHSAASPASAAAADSSTTLSVATLITAIASLGTVLVAAIAVLADGKRARLSLGLSNLWKLIEGWDSPEMRERRAAVAGTLLKDGARRRVPVSDEGIDVLNTFELLGYLVLSKNLRLEDAWVNFSAWAISWWYTYEGAIGLMRADDDTVFEGYAELVSAFVDYEARRRGISREAVIPSERAIRGFLEAERDLLSRLAPSIEPSGSWTLFERIRYVVSGKGAGRARAS